MMQSKWYIRGIPNVEFYITSLKMGETQSLTKTCVLRYSSHVTWQNVKERLSYMLENCDINNLGFVIIGSIVEMCMNFN